MGRTVALVAGAVMALAVARAGADDSTTARVTYPGLMCQPHSPTIDDYGYGTFTDIKNLFVTPGDQLGLNCAIPKDPRDVRLSDVQVTLDDSDPANTGTCHTHAENLAGNIINYVFGPEVPTSSTVVGFRRLTVPGVVPAARDAIFNLHCHIGAGASLHDYRVSVVRGSGS